MKPQFWLMPAPNAAALAVLPDKTAELDRRLRGIAERFPHAVFASSLAAEDMIITDRIAALGLPLRVITLDTGKLHRETAALIAATRAHYPALDFAVFAPDSEAAAQFEREFGAAAVYRSTDLRKTCCRIRKIAPLDRALDGAAAWLTGQRRSQSPTRAALDLEERDPTRGCAKFNPLFDWADDEVWAYVQTAAVPLNALYAQGYPSIGCEPCTRPVKQGEDIRAGRWWWEQQDSKECGLHQQAV